MSSPITFLSDFGRHDEFVGVVHGVIAKLAPLSAVIDLNHEIARGDIRSAALSLTRAIQYLPEGVVLAVVDPGVGTERRALAIRSDFGFFVAPDNGLVSPAVAMIGGATEIVSIENPEARIPSSGATFQGRDVFAPAAALLATDASSFGDLGPVVDPDSVMPMMLPLPDVGHDRVTGEVWWVDGFGNCQTNIGPEELGSVGLAVGDDLLIGLRGQDQVIPWVQTYADGSEGQVLAHVDSAGLIAIAARGDSAADLASITEGMALILRRS